MNWTAVLGVLALYTPAVTGWSAAGAGATDALRVLTLSLGLLALLLGVDPRSVPLAIFVLGCIVVVLAAAAWAWILSRKGRTKAWVLLALIVHPIGDASRRTMSSVLSVVC